MNILQNIDLTSILQISAIGFGLLLALLSFYLLITERKKKEPDKKTVVNIRLFMLFSIVILILGLLSVFIKTTEKLKVDLGGQELQVSDVKTVSPENVNRGKYYINQEERFAFANPDTKNWSQVTHYSGIVGIFKIMEIDSDVLTMQTLANGLLNNPLGNVISDVSLYYFENQESRKTVSVTDSSGTDLVEYYYKKARRQLLNPNSQNYIDTSKVENKKAYHIQLNRYRRSLLGFNSFVGKESFLLYVFPKNKLDESMKNTSLPEFFISLSSFLGLKTEKLVATRSQILIGSEIYLHQVLIGSVLGNYQNKKWMLFTENDNYFYAIEINYSPQLSKNIDLWDQLQSALQSFVLLSDKQ